MLEALKEAVFKANMQLPEHGLVTFTWGNASGIDRTAGLVVIKPSGVAYEDLRPGQMVVVDLDGQVVEGSLAPSSDTPTHVILYRSFPTIGGIVHTHSPWATVFAQAGRGIRAYGTTHADYFHGEVPCTRPMTPAEIQGDYERETGRVIIEAFAGLDPDSMPGVLVRSHGPFTWGKDAGEAVYHAVVIEQVARMAYYTESLSQGDATPPMPQALLDRHHRRKHGVDAYYGQQR